MSPEVGTTSFPNISSIYFEFIIIISTSLASILFSKSKKMKPKYLKEAQMNVKKGRLVEDWDLSFLPDG